MSCVVVCSAVFLFPPVGYAFDADDLSDLVGYTIIAASAVRGDFEGADYDKPVALDNGMMFEFTEYSYTYSYRPTAVVFARTATLQQKQVTVYKLLVDDEMYDVRRIR